LTQQYLRNLSLIVADPAGKGLELGDLRCVFEVRRGDWQTPNSCDVKVYNLSTATANRLNGPEFTQLALQVGYQDQQLQLIFRGSICQMRKGREDQKNSYVAITAADGDEAYNFAASAFTLAAGSSQLTAVTALIRDMARAAGGSPTSDTGGQVVTPGYAPQLTSNKLIRGRTYYGMTRDEMRDLAAHNNCTWSIQDGQLVLIPLTSFIPGQAVLITPYTGLIGVPEQTQNGLEMTVLLNSAIRIGQLVKLDSSDVNQLRYGLDLPSQQFNPNLAAGVAKLNADGLYYVLRAEHNGDTRGTAWYTKLTCMAVDATYTNQQQANQASIASPYPSPPRVAIKQY
jgi:hypothetical protein